MRNRLVMMGMIVAWLGGCATYTTPGGGVSIAQLSDPDIAEIRAQKPSAQFPARLIVARVQAGDYSSASGRGYGSGRYTVLTTRDIETEADFARLGAMKRVAAVGPISRLLLSNQLDSTRQLRTAAAQLHGDILLIYTIDTSFYTDTQRIGPLQAVSLGFFPNKKSHVTATCSAAFVDVGTGYVYGVAESTATNEQRSDLWGTQNAIEKARRSAERDAFSNALGEIEKTWTAIVVQQQTGK